MVGRLVRVEKITEYRSLLSKLRLNNIFNDYGYAREDGDRTVVRAGPCPE